MKLDKYVPGYARPKETQARTLRTLALDSETHARLKEAAKRAGLSMNHLTTALLNHAEREGLLNDHPAP